MVQYPTPRGATDRSVSDFDHRHLLAFTYIYDIPKFQPHDAFATGAGYLLNGWQLSGTTAFQSGTPYNVDDRLYFDSNGDGVNNDRPSLGNPRAPLASYAIAGDCDGLSPNILCDGPTWFSPTGHCTPVSPAQVHWIVPPNGQGNVGRNSLIGPWYSSWAFSLNRDINLHAQQALQIRADLFNPFNQTHKDGDGYWPNMQLGTGIVPAGSGVSSTFANFATSQHGGRTVRVLLRYSF